MSMPRDYYDYDHQFQSPLQIITQPRLRIAVMMDARYAWRLAWMRLSLPAEVYARVSYFLVQQERPCMHCKAWFPRPAMLKWYPQPLCRECVDVHCECETCRLFDVE